MGRRPACLGSVTLGDSAGGGGRCSAYDELDCAARGSWLNEARSVHDLPAAFDKAAGLPIDRFGFDNYPQQRLAWAFALAAAGDETRAWEKFREFSGRRTGLTPGQREDLTARLATLVESR